MKSNKENGKTAQILFTAFILVVCIAVYLFTDTGYNKPPEEAEVSETLAPSGVLNDRFLETALEGLDHFQSSDNTYLIRSELFEEAPSFVVYDRGGIVRSFTLRMDMPIFAEENNADNPVESRLVREREKLYNEQLEWMDSALSNMIRALDIEERLTESDILYILHTVDTVISGGKQQTLKVAQYSVRSYVDNGAKLIVSVQDEKNESE